jgi:hypothetical protein
MSIRAIPGEVVPLTEKDLRKLNRYQLLELLVVQTERADKLQAKLDETRKEMREQEIKLSSLGSIAEASLQLEGVFQAAQVAADRYVNAAKEKAEAIVAEAEEYLRCIKGE